MPLPDDVATLAYAAGLFDGEGSISITYPKRTGSNKRYHRLQISLTSTDPRILVWFKERFGGSITNHRQGTGKWKPSARWQTNSANAEAFLRAIRPYLIIKAEQADIALALRATNCRSRSPTRELSGRLVNEPITPDLERQREELRRRLLVLNGRGVG